MNYFPSSITNPYKAQRGSLYNFEGSLLLADSPPIGDRSTKVATTEWVMSVFGVSGLRPLVYQSSDLTVRFTEGLIEDLAQNLIPINASLDDLAVAISDSSTDFRIEYVWVRYMDGAVVATTDPPELSEGIVLANVKTDNTKIVSIENLNVSSGGGSGSGSIDLVGVASLNSPTFTGTPKVPTPSLTSDNTEIANTSWVKDVLDNKISDVLNSPSLLGDPKTPTPPINDSDTSIANTLWVNNKITSKIQELNLAQYAKISGTVFTGVTSGLNPSNNSNNTQFATTSWVVTKLDDLNLENYAPLNSPVFIGNPTVPSPLLTSDSLSIANTAWVTDKVIEKIEELNLELFAPLNSPTFTGNPKGPNPVDLSNDTSLATTAWVNTKIDTEIDTKIDELNFELLAPLDSPTFTGIPTTPTPTILANDLTIANTAWVNTLFNTELSEYARLDGADFIGTVNVLPPLDSDNSYKPATTNWVRNYFMMNVPDPIELLETLSEVPVLLEINGGDAFGYE